MATQEMYDKYLQKLNNSGVKYTQDQANSAASTIGVTAPKIIAPQGNTSTKTTPTKGTQSTYKPLGNYNDADVGGEDKARLEAYGRAYNDAKAKGDTAGMEAAHQGAEGIRSGYGYSGGLDGSQKIGLGGGTAPVDPNVPVGSNPAIQGLANYIDSGAKGYATSQKSSVDVATSEAVNKLMNDYNLAIAEGKISVRDAQDQFEAQKAQIEQEAYQNTEKTMLYGNEMGIQNSQQMVGHMRSNDARNMTMKNSNMKERDSRINDVKDRINALTLNKNLSISETQKQGDFKKIGIDGEALQMASEQKYDLYSEDYRANRDQGFKFDMLEKEYGFDIKKLQEGSRLNIEEMFVGKDIDFAKMDKAFGQDLEKMAKDYGYSQALSSQSYRQNASLQSQAAKNEIAAMKSEYDIAVSRELSKFTPGTPEYNIRQNQLQEAFKTDIMNVVVEKQTAALVDSIYSDPALKNPVTNKYNTVTTQPNFSERNGMFYGTASTKQVENPEYSNYQAALERLNGFQSDPLGTLGVMDMFK